MACASVKIPTDTSSSSTLCKCFFYVYQDSHDYPNHPLFDGSSIGRGLFCMLSSSLQTGHQVICFLLRPKRNVMMTGTFSNHRRLTLNGQGIFWMENFFFCYRGNNKRRQGIHWKCLRAGGASGMPERRTTDSPTLTRFMWLDALRESVRWQQQSCRIGNAKHEIYKLHKSWDYTRSCYLQSLVER